MDYEEWITRERRLRMALLSSVSEKGKRKLHRICLNCDEICLCHEQSCPNCNAQEIAEKTIEDPEHSMMNRIRCRHRFQNLSKNREI